jgi:hypothetical protein
LLVERPMKNERSKRETSVEGDAGFIFASWAEVRFGSRTCQGVPPLSDSFRIKHWSQDIWMPMQFFRLG